MTEEQMTTFHAAFLAAQREFRDPVKDATNPHFKSRFVTLKGVMDAVRPALHKHGLTISQPIESTNGSLFVRTIVAGEDGKIESQCPVLCAKPNDPQAMGSAITYARRYSLAALCGVAPADEDDDGNDAAGVTEPQKPVQKPSAKQKPEVLAFEDTPDAAAAIEAAKTPAELEIVGRRIAVSPFLDEERKSFQAPYKAKMAALRGAS